MEKQNCWSGLGELSKSLIGCLLPGRLCRVAFIEHLPRATLTEVGGFDEEIGTTGISFCKTEHGSMRSKAPHLGYEQEAGPEHL